MYPPASGQKYAPVRFRLVALLLVFSLLALAIPQGFIPIIQTAEAASPNVVISQVYGGGGSGALTTAYTNDYVELFNTSNASVSIAGWSLQYGSSSGNFASTGANLYVFPAGTSIGAGKYLSVRLGSAGSAGVVPATDLNTPNLNMAGGSGKVALVNINTALACGATATPCAAGDARIVDLVAYGASNNGEGGTTVNGGTGFNNTNTQGGVRKSNGCLDTDDNNNDFVVSTPSGTPALVPRTSTTAANVCGGGGTTAPTISTHPQSQTITSGQTATLAVVAGGTAPLTYQWYQGTAPSTATPVGTGAASYTTPALAATTSYWVRVSNSAGAADSNTATVTVNPVVVNNPPTITAPDDPITSTTRDTDPFGVGLKGSDDNGVYKWGAAPVAGISSVVVGGGQGTPNATFTVTLAPGFTGMASFTATLSDNVNTPAATQVVNINVTEPPALDHIVISQVYGAGGNTGAAYLNDYVELFNPTSAAVNVTGWSVQYASTDGSSWQTQPIGGPIQPGEYYLISLGRGEAGHGAPLPEANIVGGILMGAGAGKIALVNNSAALSGSCPTAGVVDLVGYGSGTNCREGATTAPAPTATNAIFRKGGGFTDTNVNGSDFRAAAALPRRTAVITELGPWVSDTEPRLNVTNAPRDATVEVEFSEPVDAAGPWYDISCQVTGSHNDATVSHSADYKIWAFTPNANFQHGEQCTVTVFKDAVSDRDEDDGAPNTDTLFDNYVSSFTVVAQGAAAPYAPDVHLAMGNPSDAASEQDNYLMQKEGLALSYNRDRGTPNWVSWHLEPAWYGSLARSDTFRADPALPDDWYLVQAFDYFDSGFDRGHMTPNADRDDPATVRLNHETFLMTNIIPQSPDNNQGPWAAMENDLRAIATNGQSNTNPADDSELYIIAGGVGVGGTGSGGFANTIVGGKVTVPSHTWKVALVLPKNSKEEDDVSRVTCGAKTIAVIMPNVQGIRAVNWRNYRTTVDAVEEMTGYDFFENLPDAVENCVEAGIEGANPPGTEGGAFTTEEDTAETVNLRAVAPSETSTLTYTVVNGPAHGTLSGTGASRTYTPAPGFSGTDSFTFKVNDGARDSNVSTVNILVTEVNDAPAAAGDAKAAQEDVPLVFPASDLTSNDDAGALEESAQTLTVASVSAGPDTHGAVALNAGQVTYTPDADYNGPASFTYQVCDNGATAGNADPKCATAAVTLTVASVNDAPTLAAIPDTTVLLGGTAAFTAVGADIDQPAQALAYSLAGPSYGATIDPTTGSFSWTPAAAQGGQIYTFTVSVSDGSLSAGRTFKVAVGYTWSGVLQPVNPDGSSVFKLGRTVPVKFQLTGASAGVTNAVARLHVAKVTNGVVGTEEEEADSTSSATEGNLFRYSDGQYIFNLSTAGLSAGTYQLRVDTGDGVLRVVQISLR